MQPRQGPNESTRAAQILLQMCRRSEQHQSAQSRPASHCYQITSHKAMLPWPDLEISRSGHSKQTLKRGHMACRHTWQLTCRSINALNIRQQKLHKPATRAPFLLDAHGILSRGTKPLEDWPQMALGMPAVYTSVYDGRRLELHAHCHGWQL